MSVGWLTQISIAAIIVVVARSLDPRIEDILDLACEKGDLTSAFTQASALSSDLSNEDDGFRAAALHIKSCLELVTQANYSAAVNYHQEAKAADRTVVPPLAALHLAEKTCGGISDIFFVSAVIIKELANEDKEATVPRVIPILETRPSQSAFAQQLYDAYQTLITLTFDSGLHEETDKLVNRAISMLSEEVDVTTQTYADKQRLLAFRIRSALLSPAVFESFAHLNRTRHILTDRVLTLAEDLKIAAKRRKVHLAKLDEFVVSPTFYMVYQGYRDRFFLEALHDVYSAAYPDLNDVHVSLDHKNPYNTRKMGSSRSGKGKGKGKKEEEPSTFVLGDLGGLNPEQMTEKLVQEKRKKKEKKEKKREKRRLQEEREEHNTPLRVAFLSAHLRKHSICKLFCGVISGLAHLSTRDNERALSVYAFSALQESHEDEHTRILKASLQSREHFVHIGKTVISNRQEVTKRKIDVLVFLDVGMDPSTMIWASARLAPLQLCVWGHPTTTGSSHMDYFISSEGYHLHTEDAHSQYMPSSSPDATATATVMTPRAHMTAKVAEEEAPEPSYDAYTEQLLMLDSLGFYFHKPEAAAEVMEQIGSSGSSSSGGGAVNNTALQSLLSAKREHGTKLILFPQHLPKLHPGLDEVFRDILLQVPNSKLVLVFGASKKWQWRRTLECRWRQTEGSHGTALMDERDERGDTRILWLDNLASNEYLALLAAGDLMLDPFPFGGGVTTLESLSVCTPVLTLPAAQTVPALAAGMIYQWSAAANDSSIASSLIASSTQDFVDKAVSLLLTDPAGTGAGGEGVSTRLQALRGSACTYAGVLYSSQAAVQEWAQLLWTLF